MTVYYLIERTDAHTWWTGYGWGTDAQRAVRFCRAQDATAVMRTALAPLYESDVLRCTEHMDVPPPGAA